MQYAYERNITTTQGDARRVKNPAAGRDARAAEAQPNVRTNIGNIDYAISVSASVLVLIGVVMVFSSSYYYAGRGEGDPLYFVKKQAATAVMGFCAMYILSSVNYHYLKKLSGVAYLIANALLVAVQFMPSSGSSRANRWMTIPFINSSLQPSEVAKVGVILLLSSVIASNKDLLKKWTGVIFLGLLTAIPCALIAWSDLGSAIILAVIGFGIIFIASPHTARYVVLGAAGSGALVSYIIFGGGFRSGRFNAWLNPFAYRSTYGNQIVQSLYAVASGGFFGLGLGQSRQKIGFLPEAHNDMIFSIVCEELGFIGAFLILALFGVIIARGIRTAMNAVDTFGSLAASGAALMIGSQAIVNVAVVTNSIPNTGITLPFISSGGTSLIISMAVIGVLLNISRFSKGR